MSTGSERDGEEERREIKAKARKGKERKGKERKGKETGQKEASSAKSSQKPWEKDFTEDLLIHAYCSTLGIKKKAVEDLLVRLNFLSSVGENHVGVLLNILPIIHLHRLFYGYDAYHS